ncbi:hypothetical protein ACQUSR_12280 [Streptomyces sp. P1-3]|uniref:hypothetical protein n=1 Tax=Streptomyces sp. P1-3 TaxID=3421658 RepID=UPI003D36DC15
MAAAVLTVAAAALAVGAPQENGAAPGGTEPVTGAGSAPGRQPAVGGPSEPHRPNPQRRPGDLVAAPVRIADAAAAQLLRPGDRVDVLAAAGSKATLIARGARVAKVPGNPRSTAGGMAADREAAVDGDGALVVLTVPRTTATALAGASVTSRLAVTLW